MDTPGQKDTFLSGTRGEIVHLLRSEPRTVADLTDLLHLTDSAVRAHLAALERGAFVHRRGMRRGFRRPHVTYALTEAGESLFPNAYGPLLCGFLIVVAERVSPQALEACLHDLGHRLAARYRTDAPVTLDQRLARGLRALSNLGGSARMEESEGAFTIKGDACPLAAAVACRPEACRIAETMLADIVGLPVRERCDRTGTPRCRFEIGRTDIP